MGPDLAVLRPCQSRARTMRQSACSWSPSCWMPCTVPAVDEVIRRNSVRIESSRESQRNTDDKSFEVRLGSFKLGLKATS